MRGQFSVDISIKKITSGIYSFLKKVLGLTQGEMIGDVYSPIFFDVDSEYAFACELEILKGKDLLPLSGINIRHRNLTKANPYPLNQK